MEQSGRDVSALVFKQAVQKDIGTLSLDGVMLKVLMQFDGQKTLGRVALDLGTTMAGIRPVVSSLLKSKLIEPVNMNQMEEKADQEFMEQVLAHLSIAIGPLAGIVVDEGLEALGCKGSGLFARQAPELVNILSREIPRQEKQLVFKQAMLRIIRAKGYL